MLGLFGVLLPYRYYFEDRLIGKEEPTEVEFPNLNIIIFHTIVMQFFGK
jgi:hypothetical protein